MNSVLQVPEPQLSVLCREYRVRRLSLFGSAARDATTPASDIDLLVEFEPGQSPSLAGFSQLQDKLAALFGADKLDLATPSILRNPYRRKMIVPDLRQVYSH